MAYSIEKSANKVATKIRQRAVKCYRKSDNRNFNNMNNDNNKYSLVHNTLRRNLERVFLDL